MRESLRVHHKFSTKLILTAIFCFKPYGGYFTAQIIWPKLKFYQKYNMVLDSIVFWGADFESLAKFCVRGFKLAKMAEKGQN